MTPVLTEIDLSKTTTKGGPGLEVGPTYLVMYDGRFHVGEFDMQWYGLNFCGIYDAGAQYDPPGENSSSWQRIWLFENAEKMSAEAEHAYAVSKRRHAIDFHCTSNGQTITEEAPLEAFFYCSDVPAMPPQEDDEDEYYDDDEEDWA